MNTPDLPQPNRSDRSDRSDRSVQSDRSLHPRRLRPSGGYRTLRGYQVATVIYDGTVSFCDRFIDKRSRTHDQMVQAARSGGKNLAEGSRAAGISSQSELKLVNVARASLEELLGDYEDYLRQHGYRAWEKDDPEAKEVRALAPRNDQSDQTNRSDPTAHYKLYSRWLDHQDPSIVANALLCLIHQANYLIDQQITALERDFVQDGGYSEQLAAARIAHRQKTQDQSAPSDPSDKKRAIMPGAPACPACGKPMALRTARKGPRAGSQFWGCSSYPSCKGTRPL